MIIRSGSSRWLHQSPLHLSRLYSASTSQSLKTPHPTTPTPSTPTIAALLASPSQPSRDNNEDHVKVNGFIRSVRKQKRVSFAALADGSTIEPLQVVLSPAQAAGLSTGASVQVTGQWQQSPAGKEQARELHATDVSIVGSVESSTYPLQKKYHSAEYLRTVPHLRTRTPLNSLLLRLRSHAISQLNSFFEQRDFVQVHTPIITSSDCEGAGEVFTVSTSSGPNYGVEGGKHPVGASDHFFRSPKYLTVSSQLHLEALAQSVSRVWTISPTFRAERSDTARHLSEFYMLEAELAFVDSLEDIMALLEDMVRHLAMSLSNSKVGRELLAAKHNGEAGLDETPSDQAAALTKRWQGLADGPWPRITYTEAINTLQKAVQQGAASFDFPPAWDKGIQAEHERYLVDTLGHGSPLFVTHYPRDLKAFYMLPSSDPSPSPSSTAPGPTVDAFDLLLPDVCEVAGGSLREHRFPELLVAMRRHGLLTTPSPAERPGAEHPSVARGTEEEAGSLQWYADLRRWGGAPHGGFGLGFDRLLAYLAGVPNVREVVAFPRWAGRCDC